jgi:hypothetical protein
MRFILAGFLFILPLSSHAYFSTLNHGEVIKTGHYRLSLSPQFITSSDLGEGANFAGRFDFGLNDESDLRVQVGTGRVNFHVGGMYKWVPIPDTADQPALGLLAGGFVARQSSVSSVSVRAFPFISKRFDSDAGMFNPYISIPIGISSTADTTEVPVQFVAGSEWMPPGLERISFWVEMGFNLTKSFSYMSLQVSMYWDDETGVEFR